MLKRVIHAVDNEEINCPTDQANKTTVSIKYVICIKYNCAVDILLNIIIYYRK